MDMVVLAAGQGTRMGPLTEQRPKPLLPILRKPLLMHVLERAELVVDRIVVVIGYRGESIRETIGSSLGSTPIEYVDQPEQRGTAHAVAQAREHVEGSFLVINGDVLVETEGIDRVANTAPPAIVGTHVETPSEYGVLAVKDGRLNAIVEKPDDPPSTLVNAGIYHFDESMLDTISNVEESGRGELELTDAIAARTDMGDGVGVIEYDDFWLDVGYPWDLLRATDELLPRMDGHIDGDIAESVEIEGHVVVEDGATVKAGSVLRGPVLIGAGATVGPNAYVRDSAVIGPDATVGHSVEVKGSILMEGGTASHLSYLGDSVLGPEVNLGAGTIVANLRHDDRTIWVPIKGEPVDTGRRKFGAVLGDSVKTGINTSINAGVIIPSGVTTNPGDVILQSP